MDLVSCIITTYKRKPEILKRAIDSILNQSYQNKELIVVNDYPEDADLEKSIAGLINTYEFPIQYIVQPKNMGACKARNTGIEASCGEYVALLDDDDEWMPEKIERQLQFFTDEKIGLVYCDSYICKNGNKVRHSCSMPKGYSDTLEGLLWGNFMGGNSFPLMRRSVLIQVGLYDEKLRAMQDLDMWIRICQISECVHCEEPLVVNHISDVSITTGADNRLQGFERILEKYKDLYQKYPKTYHKRLLSIASHMWVAGKHEAGRKYFKMAFKLRPVALDNLSIPGKIYLIHIRDKVRLMKQ